MYRFLFFLSFFILSQTLYASNIGLVIMATGKYVTFAMKLVESAKTHFCKNHQITFFIFTDANLQDAGSIKVFHQEKLGWPYDTMMRPSIYLKQQEILSKQDYLFAIDADMLFVDSVGDEILGERVATLHPGYVGMLGPYEINSQSAACVSANEGENYYCGGFVGGSAKEFLAMCAAIAAMIEKDREKKIIAVWHDESYLNRYFINHKPTTILSASYCYPDKWKLKIPKKILAITKGDNNQMRN